MSTVTLGLKPKTKKLGLTVSDRKLIFFFFMLDESHSLYELKLGNYDEVRTINKRK